MIWTLGERCTQTAKSIHSLAVSIVLNDNAEYDRFSSYMRHALGLCTLPHPLVMTMQQREDRWSSPGYCAILSIASQNTRESFSTACVFFIGASTHDGQRATISSSSAGATKDTTAVLCVRLPPFHREGCNG